MDDQPGPTGARTRPAAGSRDGAGRQGSPAADGNELALLRAAVEGGLDGMVVVSSDGVMVTSNRRFQEIWPIPAEVVASGSDEAALGRCWTSWSTRTPSWPRVHELYGTASGSARDELLLVDGRVLDRYGAALRDAQGDYISWAWYFRDVTTERAAVVDAGRLGALIAVAQRLADAGSEVDVLTVASGDGASVLGAAGAVLCLSEPGAARVRTLATGFFDAGLRAEVAELPADSPLRIVRVAVTGEPVFLADREEALRRFPAARDTYVRARSEGAAVVPLTSHGRTIGSLAVVLEVPHPWRAADRALLQALAALTAQALDRLRAHQAEQEATREIRRLGEALQRSLLTPLPRVHGDADPPQDVADLGHGDRSCPVVADHVADDQRHAPVGSGEGVVPVPAHLRGPGGRLVPGGELQQVRSLRPERCCPPWTVRCGGWGSRRWPPRCCARRRRTRTVRSPGRSGCAGPTPGTRLRCSSTRTAPRSSSFPSPSCCWACSRIGPGPTTRSPWLPGLPSCCTPTASWSAGTRSWTTAWTGCGRPPPIGTGSHRSSCATPCWTACLPAEPDDDVALLAVRVAS